MANKDLLRAIKGALSEVGKLRQYDLLSAVDPELQELERELLSDQARKIQERYREELTGTPEAVYLAALVNFYDPEAERLNEKLNRKIEEQLDLSMRIYHCLRNYGITHVGQLVQTTEADLFGMRNFGKRSLRELKKELERHGLSLRSKKS